MVKRLGYILAAAVVAVNLGLSASAAQMTGSIRISMDTGELPVLNGALAVHAVGTPVTEGYRIGKDFGGGIVKGDDALSPQLARWLAEMAEEGGTSLLLDADGNVTFSNLEQGLYLVTQTEKMDGFYALEPFLLTIPMEGRWQLQVNPLPEPIITELVLPDNPATGEGPMLILGILGMLLSGIGLLLCALARRKDVQRNDMSF